MSCNNDDDSDVDPELDTTIKVELDHLNFASAEINRLENEIDEARVKYKLTFTEASNKMTEIAQKRKKSIHRAREYFRLKDEAKIAQGESLKAARQYQSAIGVYRAAKETVWLAEDKLLQKGEVHLSTAWQEMMNHGTIRVMEAEKEKRRSEDQHHKATVMCGELEIRLQQLTKKYKRSIAEARPYFELKQQLDLKLQQQKQNVTDLQAAIKEAKSKYSNSLKVLEGISETIHESRRNKLMLMFPRQPGVGAESNYSSVASGLSELVLDSLDDLYTTSAEESQDTDAFTTSTEESQDTGVFTMSMEKSQETYLFTSSKEESQDTYVCTTSTEESQNPGVS